MNVRNNGETTGNHIVYITLRITALKTLILFCFAIRNNYRGHWPVINAGKCNPQLIYKL